MSPIIKSETPGLLENDKETRHMCTHVHPPTNMMARHNHHNPNKTAKDFRSQNTHTLLPALYEYVSTCSTSLHYTSMYQHVILLAIYKYVSTCYTVCNIQVCINMLYCLHYTSMYQHVMLLALYKYVSTCYTACTIQVCLNRLYYLHYTSMHQHVILLALYKHVSTCSTSLHYTSTHRHVILPALHKYASTCYTTSTIQVCINMLYYLHYRSMYQHVLLPSPVCINMCYCLHKYVSICSTAYTSTYQHVLLLAMCSASICYTTCTIQVCIDMFPSSHANHTHCLLFAQRSVSAHMVQHSHKDTADSVRIFPSMPHHHGHAVCVHGHVGGHVGPEEREEMVSQCVAGALRKTLHGGRIQQTFHKHRALKSYHREVNKGSTAVGFKCVKRQVYHVWACTVHCKVTTLRLG